MRVTPLDDTSCPIPQRRRLGLLRGQCQVPDDFDRMAADEIANLLAGIRRDG